MRSDSIPEISPVDCGMHLVAVLLGRKGIEHHATVGELEHHVLLRRDGGPLHLDKESTQKIEFGKL